MDRLFKNGVQPATSASRGAHRFPQFENPPTAQARAGHRLDSFDANIGPERLAGGSGVFLGGGHELRPTPCPRSLSITPNHRMRAVHS